LQMISSAPGDDEQRADDPPAAVREHNGRSRIARATGY
jgi:hypothetical protein